MMYIIAYTFKMPQAWLQRIVDVCEQEMETNSQGEYVPDMRYFILRHITNYTFTFGIAGFYLGQLMLSYMGKTIPSSNNLTESVVGIILRIIIALVVGAVCAAPLIYSSS